MIFGQGSFQTGPNETPESIAMKRAYIQSMLPRFGSARYVGEGLGQLATGVVVGRQNRKLNEAEGKGRESATAMFDRLFGTAQSAQSPDVQGPLSVLGMKPGASGPALPPPDPNSPHALGDDAMAALGKPTMKTAADPASIKAGLVARGLPEHIADGFVMNFQDESGMNPGINEAAPLVPGSRGGFGLYQLTGPRRRAYEAFAADRGVPVDDVDAQLDFLMTELQGPEAAAWAKISGTQDAGQAGAAIVNHFLRPAEEHRESRTARYTSGAGYVAGDGGGSQGSIPMAELQLALQNPWLSAEQKAVISGMLDQQTAANDPMAQIELQKAQLELEQMQNPEAKPGFTQLTPQEVQQLGLPPGVYQRGPDGRIDTIEKTQGSAEDGRYQPVGGQIWDMRPDGGGPPQLVGGGTEEVIYGADGQPIVTRGPVGTSKPFTEGQSKDVVYATRAQGALATLDPIAGALTDRGDVAAGWLPFGIGGEVQNDDYQVAKTAGDEFLQAILRKDTGAAITSDEQALYGETYLPKPGDSEARLKYKQQARQRAVAAIEAGMSPAQIIAQERALAKDPPADAPAGGSIDFSTMGIPEIGQVDIGSLTPEQMDALEKRMTELGL